MPEFLRDRFVSKRCSSLNYGQLSLEGPGHSGGDTSDLVSRARSA